MSFKNISHQSDSFARRASNWSRFVFAGIVGLFIVGAIVAITPMVQSTEPAVVVEESGAIDVTYSDALSLQYAEPFLNQGVDDVVYGEALSQQYAQPWLDQIQASGNSMIAYGDGLSMQYAQPWRTVDQDNPFYSQALSQQYAQPWIAQMQGNENSVDTYGDGLSMQYAQPWIELQEATACNGRLDMQYACANGHQP